jgi:integrase
VQKPGGCGPYKGLAPAGQPNARVGAQAQSSRLQARDGHWEARVTLPDGRRKSLYGATRQEVAAKLAATIRDRDKGLLIARDERQTLATYLANWLASVRPPVIAPRTWTRYEEFVRVHLVPALGKTSLAKLSAQQVQALYTAKLAEGYAASTVRQLHVVLHEALDMALRHGLVTRKVTNLVDKLKIGRQEMRVWTPADARAFLAAVEGDRLEALYTLALATGMRQGELLGLCWRNVDLDAGVIQVQTNLQTIRGEGRQLRTPKTPHSRRLIRLTRSTRSALSAHRVHQLEERMLLGPEWEDHDLVFPD